MNTEPQVMLFQAIKAKLPTYLSLVEEVASTLEISTDSAYRRIRGEKPLSLEEANKLCVKYSLSLDSLLNLSTGSFIFSGQVIKPESFRFEEYLAQLTAQMAQMSGYPRRKMYYLCKDIPIFHHFHFREIAAFKHFFFNRTLLQVPQFMQKKFRFEDYPDELFQIGRKALDYYNKFDSVEIWNMENINSTIRQIEFCHDSNLFEQDDDIYLLYEKLELLVAHLEQQAGEGCKFLPHHRSDSGGSFEVYYNEVILGDNSILTLLNDQKLAFIIHSGINYMMTRDLRFCDHLHQHMENLIRRSTLISSVSERERSRFFRQLRRRIANRKQHLKT